MPHNSDIFVTSKKGATFWEPGELRIEGIYSKSGFDFSRCLLSNLQKSAIESSIKIDFTAYSYYRDQPLA